MNKFSARFDKQRGFASPVLLIVGGIILLVVIAIASGALKFEGSITKSGGGSSTSQPSKTTKTYENASLGISLEYPDGWNIKENPAAGVIVAFGSPKESADDKFVDNVNLSFTDLSSRPEMTLEELSNAWIKETEDAPAFNLVDRKPASMAGEVAEQLVYSLTNSNGLDIKGMTVITLKNQKAYIVTYSAEKGSFDNFLKDANKVVTSLQIK